MEERIKELEKEVKEINEILEIISKFMTNQVTINKNINESIKLNTESIFNIL